MFFNSPSASRCVSTASSCSAKSVATPCSPITCAASSARSWSTRHRPPRLRLPLRSHSRNHSNRGRPNSRPASRPAADASCPTSSTCSVENHHCHVEAVLRSSLRLRDFFIYIYICFYIYFIFFDAVTIVKMRRMSRS